MMLIPGCSFSYKRNLTNEEYWKAMKECADKGCRRCENGLGRSRHKMSCPVSKHGKPEDECICGANEKK